MLSHGRCIRDNIIKTSEITQMIVSESQPYCTELVVAVCFGFTAMTFYIISFSFGLIDLKNNAEQNDYFMFAKGNWGDSDN